MSFVFGNRKALAWGLVLALLLGLASLARAAGPAAPTVQLMAHRGFTLRQPENSLGSLRAARALGLAGAEVDLRTTRDGVIVLMHDKDLKRTTNGSGLVEEMTLAQLRALRLKDRQGRLTSQGIPTLAEALALVRAWPGFMLALDLKHADTGRVASLVLKNGLREQTIFFVSDPREVDLARAVKAADPRLQIAVDLLFWWRIEDLPAFACRALGADYLFASEWFFPKRGFQEAKKAGAKIIVFLWGDKRLAQRAARAARLGADVISSDRPDKLLGLFPPRRP